MRDPIQLIDPGSPGVDDALLESLGLAGRFARTIVMGTPAEARRIERFGGVVVGRVPTGPILTRTDAWLAGRRLRTLLDRVAPGGDAAVQSWSEAALVVALHAGVPASDLEASILAVAGPGIAAPTLVRLVGSTARDQVEVRPVGPELGPILSRRGWRVGPMIEVDDLQPFLAPPRRDPSDRPDAVIRFGLCDSPAAIADLRLVTSAIATLAVSGHEVELVISPETPGWREEARWIDGVSRAVSGPKPRVRIDPGIDRSAGGDVELHAVLCTGPRDSGGIGSLLGLRRWLAAGVPAIVTDGPAVRRLVQDGVDARVVPRGDRNAVVRAMIRFAADTDLRREMGHAAAARHASKVMRSFDVGDQASGSFAASPRAASR